MKYQKKLEVMETYQYEDGNGVHIGHLSVSPCSSLRIWNRKDIDSHHLWFSDPTNMFANLGGSCTGCNPPECWGELYGITKESMGLK